MRGFENPVKKPNAKFLAFKNKINADLKNVTYNLDFNRSESLFYVNGQMEVDSNRRLKLAVNLGGGRGILYSNIKTKKKLHQANGFGELFLISGKVSYNWIITSRKKKIGKYTCYKAILKNIVKGKEIKTEAWFSPEIPFSHGPTGYSGLPGLILEIKLPSGFVFKLKNLSLKKGKKVEIKRPTKGIKITEKKFNNFKLVPKKKKS
jgi:GLPGLI family protein